MSARLVTLVAFCGVAASSLFVTADNRIGGERGQFRYEEDDVIHRQAEFSVDQRQECFIPQRVCEAARRRPSPNNDCASDLYTEDDHSESRSAYEDYFATRSGRTEKPITVDKSIYEFLRDDPQYVASRLHPFTQRLTSTPTLGTLASLNWLILAAK